MAILGALIGLVLGGCVERTLVVTSDPPGTRVYLDTVPRGFTPLTMHFPHYGTRKIVLEHPGYHRASRIITLEAPWFERWGLSFFADVLWPGNIEDSHRVDMALVPLTVEDRELEERARRARRDLETTDR